MTAPSPTTDALIERAARELRKARRNIGAAWRLIEEASRKLASSDKN